MNLKVIKKDGSKMDFDKNKIINAIKKKLRKSNGRIIRK